jgi:hypothetical protein
MMDSLHSLAPGDSPAQPLEAPDDGLSAVGVPTEPPALLPLLPDPDGDLPWVPAGGWWLLGSDGE